MVPKDLLKRCCKIVSLTEERGLLDDRHVDDVGEELLLQLRVPEVAQLAQVVREEDGAHGHHHAAQEDEGQRRPAQHDRRRLCWRGRCWGTEKVKCV